MSEGGGAGGAAALFEQIPLKKNHDAKMVSTFSSLTDHDAEIPAWIPEKYFLTVNFEAL